MSAFTLFFGTFIHLPRITAGKAPALEINHGVLWVSTFDGRIKGFNWDIHDEDSLRKLMDKQNWVDERRGSPARGVSKVTIIRAQEDQNEFFFPGFIGTYNYTYAPAVQYWHEQVILTPTRHAHPCPPIPQFRYFRILHPARLASNLHLPARKILWGVPSRHRAPIDRAVFIRPSHHPNAIPWNNLRLVLRNHPRPRNKLPRQRMSRARPTSPHRPLLHEP